MLTRTHISAFVGLTIVTWLIALWAQGQPVLNVEFLKPFGIVVGVIFGVASVFTRYAWSWRCFGGWFVNLPDLRGTWQVTIASDYMDKETGRRIAPIIGYVVIRQSLMHISVRQMTRESRSHSISYGITQEQDEIFRLAVVYRNEPDIELQGEKSEIHHGAFWLEILGDGPDRMIGHYWTDRSTRGRMQALSRKRECYDSYELAHAAFSDADGAVATA